MSIEFDSREFPSLVCLKNMVAKKSFFEDYQSIDKLLERLYTSSEAGLASQEDLSKRRTLFGTNYIEPPSRKSFLLYFIGALSDKILILLCVVAVLTMGLALYQKNYYELIDGVAIIIAVLIVALTSSICDYKKDEQFHALQESITVSSNSILLRDGKIVEVPTKDIVVGDIICVKYGDQLTTDCILISGNDLKMDESSVTGESDLVCKTTTHDLYLLSGTSVMEGSGKAVVVAVGIHSHSGQITTLLGIGGAPAGSGVETNELNATDRMTRNSTKNVSILQKNLNHMAVFIGKVGLGVGILVALILIVRFCIQTYAISNSNFTSSHLTTIFGHITIGLSIVIVAVPEGLPLAVTLALAFSVRRMMNFKNLVRHLYSCETMGNATTICSDKTGTLTTNRMTCTKAFTEKRSFTVEDATKTFDISPKVSLAIAMNVVLNKNTTSSIESPKVPGGFPVQIGNKTECAMLGFLSHIQQTVENIQDKFPESTILKVWPFNSETKKMITIVKLNDEIVRILVKGASEVVMKSCSYYAYQHNVHPMVESDLKEIHETITQFASESLRTVALAFCDCNLNSQVFSNISTMKLPDIESVYEKNLIFTCLFGIEDPVRAEVPDAIRKFHQAGISVRMITGDNVTTAVSIAKKCGILTSTVNAGEVLEGSKFNELIRDESGVVIQEKFDKVWPRLLVLARSSPQDKYVFVNGIIESKLKKHREVVAVTGDGTNDAPALRRADVGFSMGITGTDVAKGASDIIITDDSLASLTYSIMSGRAVYDGICKFIQFQLTVNVSAIIFSTLCTIILGKAILRSIQMLWVNLVMDTLASLALATDKPHELLLQRPPYGRNRKLLSGKMIRFIVFHGVYQVIILLILLFSDQTFIGLDTPHATSTPASTSSTTRAEDSHNEPPSVNNTIIFNVFVLMQIFNELNARTVHGERNIFFNIIENYMFIIIFFSTFIIQIVLVQFGGMVFGVVRLNAIQWLYCVAISLSELLVHQIFLFIPTNVLNCVLKRYKSAREEDALIISEPDEHVTEMEKCYEDNGKITQKSSGSHDEKLVVSSLDDFSQEYPVGKILWIRGFQRLKNQLSVVNAFQAAIEQRGNRCSPAYTSPFDKEVIDSMSSPHMINDFKGGCSSSYPLPNITIQPSPISPNLSGGPHERISDPELKPGHNVSFVQIANNDAHATNDGISHSHIFDESSRARSQSYTFMAPEDINKKPNNA